MYVSFSQTRIELENIVDNTLVTTSIFYKQALLLFQEMTNICSTKIQIDELCIMMRNQNMKHIPANGIKSAYSRSKGIVLFGEDKTRRLFPVLCLHMKGNLKRNEISKNQCYLFLYNKCIYY